MKRFPHFKILRFFMLLMAAAPHSWAQTAINSGANSEALPMRNLQIEVRQTRIKNSSRNALGAQGGVVLQPGHSGADVDITVRDGQRSDSRDLLQTSLVLNGRNVTINLGNSTPLRLRQAVIQNGIVRYLGGTVFIDANSGFSARPIWRGGGSAELELAAIQSTRPGGGPLPASSSASTSLALPLNEWVTVAQSDDGSAFSSSGLTGATQSAGREAWKVELRLSVR